MAEKSGPTTFPSLKNTIEDINVFRTINSPPQVDGWNIENWKNPALAKYKWWQFIPYASNAAEAVKLKLPAWYTAPVLPKPHNVSPLIKLGRWSALLIGVVYGWTKFRRLREEEAVIRQHNFFIKCRRNRAELEETWSTSCKEMLDLAAQINLPVPTDFDDRMLESKLQKLSSLRGKLEYWSKDLECNLPTDFDALMSPDYKVQPTDKQWHSMPSYPKGTFF